MIQRMSRAPALGYWPDSELLRVEAVEDRLFIADEATLLPDGLAGELADLLPDCDLIPACDVEALLELIPDLMPDATCASLGQIFLAVLPEMFGEPPRPRKRSDAFPGSHARLEALTRRVHAKACSIIRLTRKRRESSHRCHRRHRAGRCSDLTHSF